MRAIIILFAAALLVTSCTHGTLASAQQPGSGIPTLDNPDPHAVSGTLALSRLFAAAAAGRVDFALIGDSNARLGAANSGHENAMTRAFSARFGMYATRVEPVSPALRWGVLASGQEGGACCGLVSVEDTGARSLCFPFIDDDPCFPVYACYLLPETALSAYSNFGLTLSLDCPIGIEYPLRYHLTHFISVSTDPGYVTLCARESFPGNLFHNYASAPPISTTSASQGAADVFMDVPSGTRASSGIMFSITDAAHGLGALGPAILLWNRVERPDRPEGIAYSPLWIRGGKSARHTLLTLQISDVQAPTTEWFRQATRLQSTQHTLCVHILHGGNDCFDYQPSRGPIGGLDSSTGPGHEDNLRGIIALLRSWWTAAGYDPANLYFLLGPYHPRPGNDALLQLAFEEALRTIASSDSQVIAIAGNRLSTPQELAARGLLLNGSDISHLSTLGFSMWASTTLRALDLSLQPADFNGDHATNVSDIFAYLAAFFAYSPTADFNHSGEVNVQDIFDFLATWFDS